LHGKRRASLDARGWYVVLFMEFHVAPAIEAAPKKWNCLKNMRRRDN